MRVRQNDLPAAVFFTVFIFMILLGLASIGLSIFGLILAFKASILIGILALVIEPAPFVIGLVYVFSDVNLAEKVAQFLN